MANSNRNLSDIIVGSNFIAGTVDNVLFDIAESIGEYCRSKHYTFECVTRKDKHYLHIGVICDEYNYDSTYSYLNEELCKVPDSKYKIMTVRLSEYFYNTDASIIMLLPLEKSFGSDTPLLVTISNRQPYLGYIDSRLSSWSPDLLSLCVLALGKVVKDPILFAICKILDTVGNTYDYYDYMLSAEAKETLYAVLTRNYMKPTFLKKFNEVCIMTIRMWSLSFTLDPEQIFRTILYGCTMSSTDLVDEYYTQEYSEKFIKWFFQNAPESVRKDIYTQMLELSGSAYNLIQEDIKNKRR